MNFKTYLHLKSESKLIESGFSRLGQIMTGLVPSVKTFAFITWENPMGKKTDNDINIIQNEKLKTLLKNGSYRYIQIKGKYGNLENPYFISNITKHAAIELGKSGNQESILFGNVNGEFDINFELIPCFNGEVYSRHVWKSLDDKTADFYSEYKGRKFIIPFFDDEYQTAKFDKGKIVKEKHNVFYAGNYNTHIIEEVEKLTPECIDETYTGKHQWMTRGIIFEKLRKKD
jgi:hypothetical protein